MIAFTLFGILIFIGVVICNIIMIVKKKINIVSLIENIVFGVYVILLINVVFFPIPIDEEVIAISNEVHIESRINLIPFDTIMEILKDEEMHNIIYQLMGNVILLFPLSLYLYIRYTNKNNEKMKVILCVVCVSLAIEFIQCIIGLIIGFQYRVVDIDDVILNTFGGIIGLLIGIIIKPLYAKISNKILE